MRRSSISCLVLGALAVVACGTGAIDPAAGGAGTSGAPGGSSGLVGAADAGSAADTGVASDAGAVPPKDGSVPPRPKGACKPITLATGAKVAAYVSEVFSFHDAGCALRTAALVRNDAVGPGGSKGGFLRKYTYDVGGVQRPATGTGANGLWNGFGYVVAHYGNASADAESRDTVGTTSTLLAGPHHAIHEFKWRIFPDGKPVDVTVHWFFATGRTHPVYAITYDATPAGANAVRADSRAPYGDLGWDADTKGDVEGLGWGDAYAFTTTGAGPVRPQSAWDYAKPNTIPYVVEWSKSVDAEMGLVQTQAWARGVSGGDYGGGTLAADCWGKTSLAHGPACVTTAGWTMPTDYLWPYQLSNYELPFVTTSHRMAWGATYGAVGQTSYDAFGKKQNGYPYLSYSTFVVLGTRSGAEVARTVADMEHASVAAMTATVGSVATLGAGGVGRTDAVDFSPTGYSPVYGTWDVDGDGNAATVTLTSAAGLAQPILRLRNYMAATPPAHVQLDGKELVANVDYFVTVDVARDLLWLTLDRTITGAAQIKVF